MPTAIKSRLLPKRLRTYEPRETERMAELTGVEFAAFYQRAIAFAVDAVLALFLLSLAMTAVAFAVRFYRGAHGDHSTVNIKIGPDDEIGRIILFTLTPVIYFGLSTFAGNGRTLGKRLMGIRVVSLVHEHMTLWHSIERALGYGAAALEFGFGFAQYFIHPYRRTVEDRIAETIVVKEKSLRQCLSHTHSNVSE
jgi:uncharacterized RDD family membrane protein YckC